MTRALREWLGEEEISSYKPPTPPARPTPGKPTLRVV
jgi:hypothetical protein